MAVTNADVRNYMFDRVAADNPVLLQLAFSEEEIDAARKTAAREYYSLPPLVGAAPNPDKLPDDTNMFFDAIAAALFRSKIIQLSQNDIEYQGGSVAVKTAGVRLEHMQRLAQEYQQRFIEAATLQKRTINISQGYGPI